MAAKRKARRMLHVERRGSELPGLRCGVCDGLSYENIHVGVQKSRDTVDLVRGDAASAQWSFDIEVDDDGDFYGPHVQGKKGDRFFYLSWGTVDARGAFTMFRRAKLMLDGVSELALGAASLGGKLVGELPLTMANGTPLCAAVRPPKIRWRAEAT